MVAAAQSGRARMTTGRFLVGAALGLVLLGLTGCVRYVETYSVTFRSRTGLQLASGDIELTEPLPASGEIRAHFSLTMRSVLAPDRDMQAFFQTFKGSRSGRLDWVLGTPGGVPSKIDFLPMAVEFDVVATVYQRARGYWSGRWRYNNLTGSYDGGAIDISKRSTPTPRN